MHPSTLPEPASRRLSRRLRRPMRHGRRGFSMIELLVALTISGTLMASMLVALDSMFKRYKVMGDTVSSHVIARVVMHRMLAMIRTGTQFGPYPADPLDPAQNPINSSSIEFVSDQTDTTQQITTIESRPASTTSIQGETIELRGPYVLWLTIANYTNGALTSTESRPLLDGILAASFNLDYDAGPRLRRATIDLSIQPQGNTFAKYDANSGTWSVTEYDPQQHKMVERQFMSSDSTSPVIRLVASAAPRDD